MKLRFNAPYFAAFLMLLLTEALIAVFLKTGFIRHTFGDYLVVILLYCLFRSFISGKPIRIALFVLCIAYTVELLQLTTYLEYFNLENSYPAGLILGSSFSFGDLLAYTLGIITVILPEILPCTSLIQSISFINSKKTN